VLAEIDPNSVSPGIVGFITIFILGLATWLLIRSMVGHLRKVRYSTDPAQEDDGTTPGSPAGSATARTGESTPKGEPDRR
jgi:hypothetical protein